MAGADAVKFEGAHPELVHALMSAGVPVCGHIGYEPQTGERRVHGKTLEEAERLRAEARTLDEAGVFMLVLELVPAELAASSAGRSRPRPSASAPGPGTDGKVLVFPDVLGYTERNFRHNKRYAEVGSAMESATAAYYRRRQGRRLPDTPIAPPCRRTCWRGLRKPEEAARGQPATGTTPPERPHGSN